MNFISFMANVCYLFITDMDFQLVFNAAGLSWEDIPNDCFGNIGREFLQSQKDKGHELAQSDMTRCLAFLEKWNLDFKQVPRSSNALSTKYHLLREIYDLQKLGEKIAKNPEMGETYLEAFRHQKARNIDASDAYDFVVHEHALHQENIKLNRAKVIIPGFELLSNLVGGFNPGRLALLLAKTGFGKTQVNINFALNAAKEMRVAYVNMEMTYHDIARRIAAIATNTTFEDIYKGNLSVESVRDALEPIKGKVMFTSGRSMSLSQIKSWLKLHAKDPFQLVIIDYDQKLELDSNPDTPEWQAIHEAAQELEDLAKELDFCCILVAQLNREGEMASSWRTKNTAHTILHFKAHDTQGIIIQAEKNRHGPRDRAIKVSYDELSGVIKELSVIDMDEVRRQDKESKLQPARKLDRTTLGIMPVRSYE